MKLRVVAAVAIPVALVAGFFGARALDDRGGSASSVTVPAESIPSRPPTSVPVPSSSLPSSPLPDASTAPPSTDAAPTTVAAPTTIAAGELPIAAAAVAAQAAIDSGDDLSRCAFGPVESVIAAVPSTIQLAPTFAQGVADEGQVFSGGDADITYCDLVPADFSSDGVVSSVRIDVAPGAPDLATYLDEEFRAVPSDLAPDASFLGGTVDSGCLTYPDDMCLAVWQGPGLFVALLLRGNGPFVTSEATATLQAVLPVVVTNLAG